jgi:hypothetical protein
MLNSPKVPIFHIKMRKNYGAAEAGNASIGKGAILPLCLITGIGAWTSRR